MQLEVIGVGGAGCRIADTIRAAQPQGHSFVRDAFAFDTDDRVLAACTAVPESHRYQYGYDLGIDAGLEGDLRRGFELGERTVDELLAVIEEESAGDADAVLLAVGLGGGTGGGATPHLVAALQRRADRPVYVLATLPADREFAPDADDGLASASNRRDAGTASRPQAANNAVETLERLDGLASAVVCFDNEQWLRPGERLADGRARCNRELATRIGAVFAASVDEGGGVGETVVDGNDLGRIMGNESAIVTLGYDEQTVETGGSRFGLGLLSSDRDVETREAVSVVETVVRKGIHGKLTLECDREAAKRGLLLVGGPPAWLDRRAIADGRQALESVVGGSGVLGGDVPRPDGDAVFAAVVLAGVEPVERLAELRTAADRTR